MTCGLINRQAPKKPHQHLEMVEIDGYHVRTFELELAMYFIKNTVVLKKPVIKLYEQGEEHNATRYRAQHQLEPKTPVGVKLVLVETFKCQNIILVF